ncbi:hypothetical protein niasHS_007288 [Heterodera schachtii]|uniref:Uncharacterized protein n=1 Tax=Heterodera schachtii TaxID=97005 RepID=A0ABD2JJZ1_HETSC
MQNEAQTITEKSPPLGASAPSLGGSALSSLFASPLITLAPPITSSASFLLFLLTITFLLLISAFGLLLFKWHMRNGKSENGGSKAKAWNGRTPIISQPLRAVI